MASIDPNLPPEIFAEQQRLASRQRIADMLMQRGMSPVQSMDGRSPVSWTQGLAQMLAAYKGGKAQKDVEQGQAGIGRMYQEGLAKEVQRIAALRGQEIQPDPQEYEQSADQGTPQPQVGTTGDPRAAVMAALTSQYGPVREMGKLDFQADVRSKEAKEAQAARLHERQLVLEAQAKDSELDREARAAAAKEANALRLQIAQLTKAAGGRSPYYQFIGTPSGIISGNTRTGELSRPTLDGQPAVRSQDSPTLQGDIAKAKTKGDAEGKREFNMAGIGGVIKQAEDLLSGAQKPTGSGVGSMVDSVAGFFGASPAGAKEAQQLKAVAGALTSKMPRMEGPQSNLDVDLYRQMAAEVGDDTLPVERRVAALQVVKNLWLKYEKQNPDAFKSDASDGAPLTPEEQAELDRLRAKHGRPAR